MTQELAGKTAFVAGGSSGSASTEDETSAPAACFVENSFSTNFPQPLNSKPEDPVEKLWCTVRIAPSIQEKKESGDRGCADRDLDHRV